MAKTILGKFLEKIGDFFKGLFSQAEKTWDKLSPDVQEALLKGSEIIALINKNVNEAPEFVIELIQSKTGVDRAELQEALAKVAAALNVAKDLNSPDLETLVKGIQAHLDASNSVVWAGISSLAAKLIAAVFSPGTKWAVFESLAEFVYQQYIKKD